MQRESPWLFAQSLFISVVQWCSLIAVCILGCCNINLSLSFSSPPFSRPQRCGAVTFKRSEQNAIQVRMLGKNPHWPEYLRAEGCSYIYILSSKSIVQNVSKYLLTVLQVVANLWPSVICSLYTEAYFCYLCVCCPVEWLNTVSDLWERSNLI